MPWRSLTLVLLLTLALLPTRPAAGQQQATPPISPAPREAPLGRGVLAYYVPYDPTSWASLEAQAELIDVVAVQWVTVDACGGLTSQDNQSLKQLARQRGLRVFPSLLTFSGWLNNRLLTDEPTSAAAIANIVEYVLAEGYDGFDLDLEAVRPADRDAYTAFVARLGAALHARGKALSLAVPPKASDTRGGWAGAFDYAALAPHVDLVTIMAYEYSGAWGAPGPVAPYNQVEAALAFATSQIPPEKVLLGLAFYGYDWNTTSGGGRYLGYPQAAALAARHGVPIALDPASRSATFRYSALGAERPPAVAKPPRADHLITERQAPPCPIADPAPTPTPTPRPTPPPDQLQEHVVWLEESASAAARLGLAERYGTRGVATWCLGLEDPLVWPLFERWRQRG
jgi:spore germination protein YaaH